MEAQLKQKGIWYAGISIYFTWFFGGVRDFSEFFQKAAEFDFDFYVLQFGDVDYMDLPGVSGFGDYRGGGGGRGYECAVFCDIEKD